MSHRNKCDWCIGLEVTQVTFQAKSCQWLPVVFSPRSLADGHVRRIQRISQTLPLVYHLVRWFFFFFLPLFSQHVMCAGVPCLNREVPVHMSPLLPWQPFSRGLSPGLKQEILVINSHNAPVSCIYHTSKGSCSVSRPALPRPVTRPPGQCGRRNMRSGANMLSHPLGNTHSMSWKSRQGHRVFSASLWLCHLFFSHLLCGCTDLYWLHTSFKAALLPFKEKIEEEVGNSLIFFAFLINALHLNGTESSAISKTRSVVLKGSSDINVERLHGEWRWRRWGQTLKISKKILRSCQIVLINKSTYFELR